MRNRAPNDGLYVVVAPEPSAGGKNRRSAGVVEGVSAPKNRDACFRQDADERRRVLAVAVTVSSVAGERPPGGGGNKVLAIRAWRADTGGCRPR